MSEELLQRDLKNPPKFGRWDFYNIGATSIKSLKENNIIHNFNYGSEEKKKVDALGWNREGSVGYVFYHKHKFTTNDHHRPLLLKDEYENRIDLNYIKITLQELLFQQGFKWSKTASKEKVQELEIEIPIDYYGNISLETQKIKAERIQKIEEIKQKFQEKSNFIINVKINN